MSTFRVGQYEIFPEKSSNLKGAPRLSERYIGRRRHFQFDGIFHDFLNFLGFFKVLDRKGQLVVDLDQGYFPCFVDLDHGFFV